MLKKCKRNGNIIIGNFLVSLCSIKFSIEDDKIEFSVARGMEGIKEASINIEGTTIKVA